jgi:hypothetical protein
LRRIFFPCLSVEKLLRLYEILCALRGIYFTTKDTKIYTMDTKRPLIEVSGAKVRK